MLGPELGLKSVDADTVGYNLGLAVGVDDSFCQRCKEGTQFPVSVLASRMVISASVADEKNLKPEMR